MKMIKLIAFDLDGTLTQHKTKLSEEHRLVLEKLQVKYLLVMVETGQCRRIFEQMNNFPIDIIGNYGMQYASYNPETKDLDMVYDIVEICNRDECEERISKHCEKHGYT